MIDCSVVIASLGTRDSINSIVESLLAQVLLPRELVIVIPRENKGVFSTLFNYSECPIINIYYSSRKGQVPQRIYGFSKSQSSLVLQLDDDIIIANSKFLLDLISGFLFISKEYESNRISVAPLIVVTDDKTSKFKRYVGRLFGLNQPKISAFGIGGYPSHGYNLECGLIESEWLPGGVVLSSRDCLNTVDYYPFAGRAYGEDIIDSILKRKRGIRLFILPKIRVDVVSDDPNVLSFRSLAKEVVVDLYVSKKINNYIFFIFPILKVFLKAIYFVFRKF